MTATRYGAGELAGLVGKARSARGPAAEARGRPSPAALKVAAGLVLLSAWEVLVSDRTIKWTFKPFWSKRVKNDPNKAINVSVCNFDYVSLITTQNTDQMVKSGY